MMGPCLAGLGRLRRCHPAEHIRRLDAQSRVVSFGIPVRLVVPRELGLGGNLSWLTGTSRRRSVSKKKKTIKPVVSLPPPRSVSNSCLFRHCPITYPHTLVGYILYTTPVDTGLNRTNSTLPATTTNCPTCLSPPGKLHPYGLISFLSRCLSSGLVCFVPDCQDYKLGGSS